MAGYYFTDEWLRARTGAHRTTIARWRRDRTMPAVVLKLAALELDGLLEHIHTDWHGWKLCRKTGELQMPHGYSFTVAMLNAVPLRYQYTQALKAELAQVKTELQLLKAAVAAIASLPPAAIGGDLPGVLRVGLGRDRGVCAI